ncbi:MAG: hypothetical protein J6S13_06650 [Clostridia bacterium]|nr:hypothetical protein [Clostridia bacterium]
MKRVFAIFICILLLVSVCTTAFAAGNSISLRPTKTAVTSGDSFTVLVVLNGEEPFQSFGLKLKYDSNDFELVKGNWLLQGSLLSDFDEEKNNAAIGYKKAAVKNGDAFEFTLKVKSGVAGKTSKIEVVPVMKKDSDNVAITGASVDITIGGGVDTSHTHSFGEWEITKEPICDENGEKIRGCSGCTEYEKEVIPYTGHSYSNEWTVDEPATCTEFGVKSHHCSKCDAKKDITHISALGHKWSEWVVETEATVDKVGKKVRSCQNEGCVQKEYAEIARLSADGHTHSFGEWSVSTKATCEDSGEQVRTCSICKEQEKMDIASIGHAYGEWVVKVAPTNTADGLLESKCSNCSATKTEVIPKLLPDESAPQGTDNDPTSSDTDAPKGDKNSVNPIVWVAIGAFVVIVAGVVVLVVKNRKK